MFLHDGFAATSASELGTIRLLGAAIGGQVNCSAARLANTTGPALNADNLQADRDVGLDNGFTAISASAEGTVLLTGAHIRGLLACNGARLENTAGPAFVATGLRVDHDVILADGFTAASTGSPVVLVLADMRVGAAPRFDLGRAMGDASIHESLIEVDGLLRWAPSATATNRGAHCSCSSPRLPPPSR